MAVKFLPPGCAKFAHPAKEIPRPADLRIRKRAGYF
jgi:hypothetical protein